MSWRSCSSILGGKRRAKFAAEDAQECCRALVEGINVMLEQQGEETIHLEGLTLSDLCGSKIILKDVGNTWCLGEVKGREPGAM